MFSKAKVGDKVWSVGDGNTTIERIREDSEYRIIVTSGETYTVNGKLHSNNLHPSLFWEKPYTDIPPAPKRIVKKNIERWLNLYDDGRGYIYKSKREADEATTSLRIACVHLTGQYEAEED